MSRQDLLDQLAGLQLRLASQPLIEQSKGILMCHYRIGPDAAFEVLRRWSSHTNRKLGDISETIVVAAAQPAELGHPVGPDLIHLIDRLNQAPSTGT